QMQQITEEVIQVFMRLHHAVVHTLPIRVSRKLATGNADTLRPSSHRSQLVNGHKHKPQL
ncbi:MAG: hypothetical protein AAGB15_15060, partial [Pseudomonadota bacterium]